jgi:four helix bundle protein
MSPPLMASTLPSTMAMAGFRDPCEIDAWKLARELEDRVADVLERPGFRRFSRLLDQLARSSEGPPVHISEGFSRFYPSENAPFVRIARASISETIIHLHKAQAKGLIDARELVGLTTLAKRARNATTGYLLYLESQAARDAAEQYRGKRRRRSQRAEPKNERTEERENERTEELERPNFRSSERKNDL